MTYREISMYCKYKRGKKKHKGIPVTHNDKLGYKEVTFKIHKCRHPDSFESICCTECPLLNSPKPSGPSPLRLRFLRRLRYLFSRLFHWSNRK